MKSTLFTIVILFLVFVSLYEVFVDSVLALNGGMIFLSVAGLLFLGTLIKVSWSRVRDFVLFAKDEDISLIEEV